MLRKQHRLPRALFLSAFRQAGRPVVGRFLRLSYAPAADLRASVVVSKKVAQSAVMRNRLRRQLYGVIVHHLDKAPFTGHMVLAVLPSARGVRTDALYIEFEELLKKSLSR